MEALEYRKYLSANLMRPSNRLSVNISGLDKSDPNITEALRQIRQPLSEQNPTNWCFFSLEISSAGGDMPGFALLECPRLLFHAKGPGGLEELKEQFKNESLGFGLLKIHMGLNQREKFVLFSWVGEDANVSLRTRANAYKTETLEFFQPHDVHIQASHRSDISESAVAKRLVVRRDPTARHSVAFGGLSDISTALEESGDGEEEDKTDYISKYKIPGFKENGADEAELKRQRRKSANSYSFFSEFVLLPKEMQEQEMQKMEQQTEFDKEKMMARRENGLKGGIRIKRKEKTQDGRGEEEEGEEKRGNAMEQDHDQARDNGQAKTEEDERKNAEVEEKEKEKKKKKSKKEKSEKKVATKKEKKEKKDATAAGGGDDHHQKEKKKKKKKRSESPADETKKKHSKKKQQQSSSEAMITN